MIYFKVRFITHLSFFCFNLHFFVSFWSFTASCVLIMAAHFSFLVICFSFRLFCVTFWSFRICFSSFCISLLPFGCFVSLFVFVSPFPPLWNFLFYCNIFFTSLLFVQFDHIMSHWQLHTSCPPPALYLLSDLGLFTSLRSTEKLSVHTARKSVPARQGTALKRPVVTLRWEGSAARRDLRQGGNKPLWFCFCLWDQSRTWHQSLPGAWIKSPELRFWRGWRRGWAVRWLKPELRDKREPTSVPQFCLNQCNVCKKSCGRAAERTITTVVQASADRHVVMDQLGHITTQLRRLQRV